MRFCPSPYFRPSYEKHAQLTHLFYERLSWKQFQSRYHTVSISLLWHFEAAIHSLITISSMGCRFLQGNSDWKMLYRKTNGRFLTLHRKLLIFLFFILQMTGISWLVAHVDDVLDNHRDRMSTFLWTQTQSLFPSAFSYYCTILLTVNNVCCAWNQCHVTSAGTCSW